jgi:hypothetical protein
LVGDPEYHRRSAALGRFLTVDMLRRAARRPQLPSSRLASVAGSQGRELAILGSQYEAALASAMLQLASLASDATHSSEDAATAPEFHEDDTPLAVFYDPLVPVEVAEAIFSGLTSQIAMVAVHAAAERGSVKRWLTQALLERWVQGRKRFLAFVGAIPGVTIAERILPAAERLDLTRVRETHEAAEKGYAARLDRSRSADADVYPPVETDG